MAACAYTANVEISASRVGSTIYLLSEGGKHNAINVNNGGTIEPIIPTFGKVCLAVGELNLNLFNADRQLKNTIFFIFIYVKFAEQD